MNEYFDFIDGVLARCEDVLHDTDGNDVTTARKYLQILQQQLKMQQVSSSNFLMNRHDTIVPYWETCSCNPKNGGSGICGCILGNGIIY
jgi:hypothetical protein